jgi:formamidopyrimidine-DNA glycosylase
MPELPEVETIRRQLAPALEGRRIEVVEVRDPRWCEPAPPEAVEDALRGRMIERLGRRGKYLIVSLEDDVHLVMHLRMTGNLLLVPASEDDPDRPHLRVRIGLGRRPRGGGAKSGSGADRAARAGATPGTGGRREAATNRLLFVDVRRFGTGDVLLGSDALAEFFASRLGVEPLSPDFTAGALRALARGRRQPVKAFLLTQERVAGVGNIYADEALFRARIHPLRAVGSLKRRQIEALRDAVVATLELGIDAKGASIDDYRHVDGAEGSFQDRFLVHTRAGEPCPRCGTPIQKLRAAGRGTYVCPHCQPRPRARRVRT